MFKIIFAGICCLVVGIVMTWTIRATSEYFWAGVLLAIITAIALFTRPDIGIW